jgi:hypothetical protein
VESLFILRESKESPERVVAARRAYHLALDMKRRNVIDIIERFQTHYALQEEREMKNFHASPNGAIAPGVLDKSGLPPKGIFENEQVRVSTASVPKGTDWSVPQDGRDRVVVLLGKINQVAKSSEEDSFSFPASRLTWIRANSGFNATNNSNQTKNLMILEFKVTATEQALVHTEALRPKVSQ